MEIRIFPNTGHHYYFVPCIPKSDGREEKVLKQFPEIGKVDASWSEKLCQDMKDRGWLDDEGNLGYPVEVRSALERLCINNDQRWRALPKKPWARYRFGSRTYENIDELGEVEILGIWLAVESNLGGPERGYEVERIAPAPPDHAGWKCLENGKPIPSPYAATDVTRIRQTTTELVLGEGGQVSVDKLGGKFVFAVLEFIWQEPAGDSIDVDLVVDFGNTRTAVLALEDIEAAHGKLSSVCRPVLFLPRGAPYDKLRDRAEDAIAESWIILHETTFSEFRPPRFQSVTLETSTEKKVLRKEREVIDAVVHRAPQMFVDLSHVVMGRPAEKLLARLYGVDNNLGQGGKFTLSSPKLYAWDTDLVGYQGNVFWTMMLHPWSPERYRRTGLPKLKGEVLRFLPISGRDWELEDSPLHWQEHARPDPEPDAPAHPRADSLCWTALSLLEQAYRQISSAGWRQAFQPFVPRRLRHILVTFPSGWTKTELAAYRAKWEKAVNIFSLGHLADPRPRESGGQRPDIAMDLDEAVAAQLPIVYSEIHHLGDDGENWLRLVGRGPKNDLRARVLSLDIGGGTADTSIVEYKNRLPGGAVSLEATLLFKDSSTTAGDFVVKKIIEQVLLPSIASVLTDDVKRSQFEEIINGNARTLAEHDEWSTITRLVLLPIVRRWLEDLGEGHEGNPEKQEFWAPADILGDKLDVLQKLNEKFASLSPELVPAEQAIPVDYDAVREVIRTALEPVLTTQAKYVAAFECDLVVVTGKPSELPTVRETLESVLPIVSSRIVMAKEYPAGDWFPMSRDGRIKDAKLATSVGAALYQAVKNGSIPNWQIERRNSAHLLTRNWWGQMPSPQKPNAFAMVYLKPNEDQAKDVPILINTRIGRKLLPSASQPEQVYVFRWKDRNRRHGQRGNVQAVLTVNLKRVVPKNSDRQDGESLVIQDVTGEFNGEPVTKNDVELKLCTLADGQEHWLDTGRFEICWPVDAVSS